MSAESARPDLSGLDPNTRVNIAVAETQGATWNGEGELWLEGRPLVLTEFHGLARENPYPTVLLPDYRRDPAASWSLMVKERIETRFGEIGGGAFAREYGMLGPWHHGQDLGEAVCRAVLAKYGVEPEKPNNH